MPKGIPLNKYSVQCQTCKKVFVTSYVRKKKCVDCCNKPLLKPSTRHCKHCDNPFSTIYPNKKFCSDECVRLNHKKTHPIAVCIWCKQDFSAMDIHTKYCSTEHGYFFRQMIHRIYQAYPFNHAKVDLENAKLAKEGKNYVLGA